MIKKKQKLQIGRIIKRKRETKEARDNLCYRARIVPTLAKVRREGDRRRRWWSSKIGTELELAVESIERLLLHFLISFTLENFKNRLNDLADIHVSFCPLILFT